MSCRASVPIKTYLAIIFWPKLKPVFYNLVSNWYYRYRFFPMHRDQFLKADLSIRTIFSGTKSERIMKNEHISWIFFIILGLYPEKNSLFKLMSPYLLVFFEILISVHQLLTYTDRQFELSARHCLINCTDSHFMFFTSFQLVNGEIPYHS